MLGAILVSDAFQLGQRKLDGAARGLVMLFVPLLCVGIGLVLSLRARRVFTIGAVVMCAAVGALILAEVLYAIVWPDQFKLVFGGVALGLAGWLPVLLLLEALLARTRRVRTHSLIHTAYERAAWFALAVVALLGGLLVSVLPSDPTLSQRSLSASTAMLAGLLLPWYALRSVSAFRAVRRIAENTGTMRQAEEVAPNTAVFDLGVGDTMYVDSSGSAYRRAAASRTIVGSPDVALGIVKRETVFLASTAAVLVALAIARLVWR